MIACVTARIVHNLFLIVHTESIVFAELTSGMPCRVQSQVGTFSTASFTQSRSIWIRLAFKRIK